MILPFKLNKDQNSVVRAKLKTTIFLEGAAGTGKTATGAARLAHLLESGISAGSILVLLPQLTLDAPYRALLNDPQLAAGGTVEVVTLGGLARQMVDMFWPLVAEKVGFKHPDRRPTFLSLETAQYFMARLIEPIIEREGYFEAVSIDRNRLYSQIIDNLNKAALVGFPHTEIGSRLKDAWIGDAAQEHMYEDVQRCAVLFRTYCLENSLLDFSLQMEIFMRHLWDAPPCRAYLTKQYRHLIADNIEEDNPAAHRVLGEWLPV
ncbi:MAG: UvrD-helicase domain-containing protein, partial [Chitinophagaceae bacterium]|nr:UvrD-helicase domain-containing protein [Anaerolineae bacterium]